MGDAGRVAQLEANANDDSESSFAGGGTSSSDNTTETQKRRRLKDWVIKNPVDTALHPAMDLPGKRIKITNESCLCLMDGSAKPWSASGRYQMCELVDRAIFSVFLNCP
jgi:hypothetical protein